MTQMFGQPDSHDVAKVYELIGGVASTAAIGAAVQLGLFNAFDGFDNEVVAANVLATRVDAAPDTVNRLLRALAARGLVDQVGERSYRRNTASYLLVANGAGNAVDVCRLLDWSLDMWQHLGFAVRTGGSAFPLVHGKTLYEYLATDAPETAELFNRAMANNTELTIGAAVDLLDMTGVGTVADIGGGGGRLLRAVLERNPTTCGVLFDLESVLGGADTPLARGGHLADRVELVAGDFRRSVPVKADLYLIKQVLHNWDDQTAVGILSNIVASAPVGARVVAMELMIGGGGPLETVHTGMDLLMLLFLGGKERTEREFVELFRRAGLDLLGRTIVADGLLTLVEGQVRRR
ncbi:MAG TPA: methyltransferase [Pseudonocardiaceae bacterium]